MNSEAEFYEYGVDKWVPKLVPIYCLAGVWGPISSVEDVSKL